jgi:hypothetical protein
MYPQNDWIPLNSAPKLIRRNEWKALTKLGSAAIIRSHSFVVVSDSGDSSCFEMVNDQIK